ncbi:MAG TPA: histidine--tRNA ligase [Actinomycetota bacterium]|nr:histidine--tRNA ligase [Actinomycetota bacterium]
MKQPRGTQDFLPPASERFWALEQLGADIIQRAGYGRIITPAFEETDLFERGVGESTDIVNKEMYTFSDRSDNSLTLRPEGTASVMRAIVTHHLWDNGLPIKLYYDAAMFRYERPQKGRFRQHHQLGIEAVGSEDPALDAEVIELGHTLLREARAGDVTLLLNSMGHRGSNCRDRYLPALRAFLEQHRDELDADCKRRMVQNPLRVFDCKVPEDQAILANAPMLSDFICEDCRAHLASVEGFLDDAEIKYDVAPRLVRGFDYYTRTTFEFRSDALDAAQNAVGGGGRYDGLVEEIGGPPLPGIGFGLGIERILLAQEAAGGAAAAATLDCYVIPLEQAARSEAVRLTRRMREAGLAADVAYVERGLKTQLKHADRTGARFAALIGEKELAAGRVTMRNMTSGEQALVGLDEATAWLAERPR